MSSQRDAANQLQSHISNQGVHFEDLKNIETRIWQGLARQQWLKPDQVRGLRVLVQHGNCSQAEVINETGFPKHKVSKIVCQLFDRRLLRRRTDKMDSRKHQLRAGSKAKQLLGRLDQLTEQELQGSQLQQEVNGPSEALTSKPPASEQHPEATAIAASAEAAAIKQPDAISEGKDLLAPVDHLNQHELQAVRLDANVNAALEPLTSKSPASEQHAEGTAITPSAESEIINKPDAPSKKQSLVEWICETNKRKRMAEKLTVPASE